MSRPIYEPADPRRITGLGYDTRQLYRRPPPPGTTPTTVPTIHFCAIQFDTQTFTSSTTTFTVCEIDEIRVTDTDYFGQADISTWGYGILCKKKGLYYVEARINEVTQTGIGSHDPSGYPRDLVVDWPNGTPVEISGLGMNIGATNFYGPESAESTFVGWKNAVNALADPPHPGVGNLREITTITRLWFSMNQDDSDQVLRFAYRQASGFDQTTTALGNGIVLHFPSDADELEFSEWELFTY